MSYRNEWKEIEILAKDLLVYNFVKEKINKNKTYDDNRRIVIKEYEKRYMNEK